MSEVIPGLIVTATFLLLSAFAFLFLTEIWSDQSREIQASTARHVEQTNTSIAIQSGKLGMDLGCNTLTAPVDNTGQTSVTRFSQMDLLANYTDTSSAKVVNHLEYTTDWTVASLVPDTRDPNQWNPAETATFKVPISPLIQFDSTGTLVVVTPGGVADSSYFSCPTTHYFHSETSNINSIDFYQLKASEPDGTGTTLSASIASGQVARIRPSPNDGKFVIPLTDTPQIGASTWDITYRLRRDKPNFGFVWFTNAKDISLSTLGSWRDIDLTAHVPSIATGAVVEVVNTVNTVHYGAVRGKADTRDYLPEQIGLDPQNHRWQIVEIDENGLIQGHIDSNKVDFKLLGYTIGADPVYFPTPPDITPVAFDAWTVSTNLVEWLPHWVEMQVAEGQKFSMGWDGYEGVWTGTYLEVDRPERLVFTWVAPEGVFPSGSYETIVTLTFEEVEEGRTSLLLEHSGFREPAEFESQLQAWRGYMFALRAHLLRPTAD